MIGSSTCLPKNMISPEMPSTLKLIATVQCTTWSTVLNRRISRPLGRSCSFTGPKVK